MSDTRHSNVLITGRPGVGKTTVIMRLAELLADHSLAGFYTEELRGRHGRFGFRAVTLTGHEATLAHVDVESTARVGRYGVDVPAFEALVLPELARTCDIVLIDEIGKMECFSSRFISAVESLLDSPTSVVATVAMKGRGFIEEVKSRPDVDLHEVTRYNRNALPTRLVPLLA